MSKESMSDSDEVIAYTMKLEERLHRKLEGHLKVLRHIEHCNQTKQHWITEAIKSKLKREKALAPDQFPRAKRLSLRLSQSLDNLVRNMVERQKRVRQTSYSKKQWIEEAIYEKLEEEEAKTREFLDSLG